MAFNIDREIADNNNNEWMNACVCERALPSKIVVLK